MILASKSPRRKEILESMGFDLDIIVKEVEEVSEEKLPEDWAMDIAKKKALAVAYENQDKWVLGADTAVIFKGSYRDWETDRKSTRLNSSHITRSRMPSSA